MGPCLHPTSVSPAGCHLLPKGSDGSAAGGGRSDLSEWQRSARDEGALAPRTFAGHRNRRRLWGWGILERVVRLEEMLERPSAREVLQELRSVGLCRATDCLHIVNGRVELKPEALEGEKGAGILSLEYTEKGWKVKFCDKLKALELLGDHLGLFREHTVRETENCNLLEAILDGTREELDTDDLSELQ